MFALYTSFLETFGPFFQSSSYLHWGSMLAGVLLVSSPIIIHLINRMRFRRIRWAAMEFLLKAQKRMRRKMILEQLVLLLLRILIILLVGLLIARFIGFDLSGQEARQTSHVVVLDDSPSMADPFKTDDGNTSDPFQQGKKLITDQIVPAAAQATTPQFLNVMLLSELDKPIAFTERLNDKSAGEVKSRLERQTVSTIRVPLYVGLLQAKDKLLSSGTSTDTARIMHVVSDFRGNDWTENGPALKDALDQIKASGIKIHFVDATHPFRKADRKNPLYHDNLAITELTPGKPVVAKFEPVEFTMKIHNYGTSEIAGRRFAIKVNGDENKVQGITIKSLLPGQTHVEKFLVTPDRVATPDKPFDRFSIVTAALAEEENGGLQADNVRHAVIEVRDRLPILVIDGNPDSQDRREGNSFYLRSHFTSTERGYQWVSGDVRELEKPDLSRFAFIMILNVPTIPEAAARGLDKYVRAGGGCAFFTGPGIKPSDYNKYLYRGDSYALTTADGNTGRGTIQREDSKEVEVLQLDGKVEKVKVDDIVKRVSDAGLFPVPLPESPSKELNQEEMFEKKFESKFKKFLLRDPSVRQHPALVGMYTDERGRPKSAEEVEKFFNYIAIFRYWPIKRPGKWTGDATVRELFCMPNNDPIKDYEQQVDNLVKKIVVPARNPNIADDVLPTALERVKSEILTKSRTSDPIPQLAALFDKLLADQQSAGDADDVALREFWARPENADLRGELARLRDLVKFGDPIYFAKEFGKGRVSVFLSSSGEVWNNWASEKFGNVTFPIIIKEMSNYLTSGGIDEGYNCGTPIELNFDPASYNPGYRHAFLTHNHDPKGGRGVAGAELAPMTEPAAGTMEAIKVKETEGDKSIERDQLVVRDKDTAKPGVHLYEFKQLVKGANATDPTTEISVYKATAVNIDARREGNLQRVTTDDVGQIAPKVPFHSPEDTDWVEGLKNKKTDISELGYIFAILFLLLVLEQAMSVRLSYHTSGDALAEASPTAAAAMQSRLNAPQTEA